MQSLSALPLYPSLYSVLVYVLAVHRYLCIQATSHSYSRLIVL